MPLINGFNYLGTTRIIPTVGMTVYEAVMYLFQERGAESVLLDPEAYDRFLLDCPRNILSFESYLRAMAAGLRCHYMHHDTPPFKEIWVRDEVDRRSLWGYKNLLFDMEDPHVRMMREPLPEVPDPDMIAAYPDSPILARHFVPPNGVPDDA